MNVSTPHRRQFLQATGVSLALPMLETFAAPAPTNTPKASRLVCIGAYLGFYTPKFYPKQSGRDYEMSPLLKPVEDFRDDFTVFSGLDHRAKNGHGAWDNFLCGQRSKDVSLDQIVADHVGHQTRHSSIHVTAGKSYRSMSYTKHGVALPMIQRPSVLYQKLFASTGDRKRTEYLLESGQSVIDQVLSDAKGLEKRITARDRDKLEEYFTSIREVEKGMEKQRKGMDQPTPAVQYKLPEFDPIAPTQMLEAEKLFYDLIALALETDSTRVATMFLTGAGQVFTLDGETLRAGYHALSHHGNDPDKIRDLVRVEMEHVKLLGNFLQQLKTRTDSQDRPLLDSTIVLVGTGMGDASRHSNRDLPTLVAGGGFDHGQHIKVNPKKGDAPLLGDLYITLQQQLGLEANKFSNAQKNLNNLFS